MISIKANDVRLVYKVRQKLSLHPNDRRLKPVSSSIETKGRNRFVHALNGVNFVANSGNRIGLLGDNGAGKTTLLKVLCGIFEPTSGTVEVAGKVDALFNINLGFRPEVTGRRNIVLRGLINGWTRNDINQKMDKIIEFSELGDFIDLPIKSYSQGMAARLAFSVATAMEPEILLMDEWIGAGDPAFQDKARQRMAELTEKAGIIILASHNLALIQRTCSHILLLEKGETKVFCTTKEYFEAENKIR